MANAYHVIVDHMTLYCRLQYSTDCVYIMASNIQDLRGYDHQFVEKYSDGLICLICLCVARDPHQLSCCGKLLCRACLEEYKKGSSNCPQCGVQIHCFADKKSNTFMIIYVALKRKV